MKPIHTFTEQQKEISTLQRRRAEIKIQLAKEELGFANPLEYSEVVQELKEINRKLNQHYISSKGL
jgi:hypothetical protein